MIGGKILVLISTSLGTVYRSIYTDEINTIGKFVISLIISLMLGLTWLEYVEEEKIRNSVALLMALAIGVLSTNFVTLLIAVGKNSENSIAEGVKAYIKAKLPTNSSDKKLNDDDNS